MKWNLYGRITKQQGLSIEWVLTDVTGNNGNHPEIAHLVYHGSEGDLRNHFFTLSQTPKQFFF